MKLFVAVLSVALTAIAPTLLLAKGEMVKITIESLALAVPIEITDPAVRQFNIWSGPGTSTFDGSQGFIINWSNRADAAPVGLHHYRVFFMKGATRRRVLATLRSHRWLI